MAHNEETETTAGCSFIGCNCATLRVGDSVRVASPHTFAGLAGTVESILTRRATDGAHTVAVQYPAGTVRAAGGYVPFRFATCQLEVAP